MRRRQQRADGAGDPVVGDIPFVGHAARVPGLTAAAVRRLTRSRGGP